MEDFLHNMDWVLPLRSDWATPVANGFTWLGYTPFFLMFLPVGYWLWDRAMFTRLAVLIAITAVVNGWFKDHWQDTRPDPKYWLDGRIEGSPGRPSGHAQVAVAMWLWLAYEIRKSWAWIAAIIITFGVCFSRLYLGVHDVDDILVGSAFGLASIGLFILLLGPSFDFWRRLPFWVHLAVILALVPLLWAVWPPEGPAGSSFFGHIAVLFLLFGWVAGQAIDYRLAPERGPRPAIWKQIVMAVGGIVVLFAIRAGIDNGGEALGLSRAITGYGGAAILGFYATGLAPMAFRALKLMR